MLIEVTRTEVLSGLKITATGSEALGGQLYEAYEMISRVTIDNFNGDAIKILNEVERRAVMNLVAMLQNAQD